MLPTVPYRCVYCRQRCFDAQILAAHESRCPERAAQEAKWAYAKRRHQARLNILHRWEPKPHGT